MSSFCTSYLFLFKCMWNVSEAKLGQYCKEPAGYDLWIYGSHVK